MCTRAQRRKAGGNKILILKVFVESAMHTVTLHEVTLGAIIYNSRLPLHLSSQMTVRDLVEWTFLVYVLYSLEHLYPSSERPSACQSQCHQSLQSSSHTARRSVCCQGYWYWFADREQVRHCQFAALKGAWVNKDACDSYLPL